MVQSAKILGSGIATTGLIGAGVGIGALWCKISLLCLQLSNSGDILKLLIPKDGLKDVHLCMRKEIIWEYYDNHHQILYIILQSFI